MADEYLGEGGYFGERALLMSVPRGANVIAQEQVCVCALSQRQSVLLCVWVWAVPPPGPAPAPLPATPPSTHTHPAPLETECQPVRLRRGAVCCPLFHTTSFRHRARIHLPPYPHPSPPLFPVQTQCMVLDRKAFTELLGPLRELLDHNLGVRVISAVPLLSNLSPTERDSVVKMFHTRPYEAGETLVRLGEVGGELPSRALSAAAPPLGLC
jgi:hypothetical protein